MREPRRRDPAELLDDRVPRADERASGVELAAHGVEHGERVEGLGHRHGAASNLLPDLQAEFDRLVDRRRPDNRRGSPPVENLEQLPLLAGAPRVLSTPLPRLVRSRDVAADPGAERLQAPGSALTELVAVRLEDLQGSLGDALHVVYRAGLRLQPHELLLDPGARLQKLIVRALDRLS